MPHTRYSIQSPSNSSMMVNHSHLSCTYATVSLCSLIHAVPTQVENITVNPGNKTVTWAAPAKPNGIIVGYRVQYWELGRRDTTEEVNTTAEELVFSYNIFSKCSTVVTVIHI